MKTQKLNGAPTRSLNDAANWTARLYPDYALISASHRVQAQSIRPVYRVAVAHPALPVTAMNAASESELRPFFMELRSLGYVEGANVHIERYSGAGQADRFPDLAKQVVATDPHVIVVWSRRLLQHFYEATKAVQVPVIAGSTIDPVGYGVVSSMARPGRNITGFTTDAGLDVMSKHIQLLRDVSPGITRIAWLAPEETWPALYGKTMQQAAKQANATLLGPGVGNPIGEAEYRRVFAAMAEEYPQGLIVSNVVDNNAHAKLIAELANSLNVPAIYPLATYVRHGGLMSYGSDPTNRAADDVRARRQPEDRASARYRGPAPASRTRR